MDQRTSEISRLRIFAQVTLPRAMYLLSFASRLRRVTVKYRLISLWLWCAQIHISEDGWQHRALPQF